MDAWAAPCAGSPVIRREAARDRHPRRSLGSWCALVLVLSIAAMAGPARTAPSVREITVAGSRITVELDPDEFSLGQDALVTWVETSARAVASFYGRFPVEKARVRLIPTRGSQVVTGRTEAIGGVDIRVVVGRATDAEALAQDWIMVHELVHLAFPSVPRPHHWIEEGLATYVEPLARLEIGEVPPERVWLDLLDGLPKGLPRAGDRGLDFTPTWGRTYWGGALFCFLAELEIRERTNDAKGLRDALRGIVAAGGSMQVRWPLRRALSVGDAAIGEPVLVELYDRMKDQPAPVDLDVIFAELGIARDGAGLRLDPSAPRASTRRAIAPEPEHPASE